MTISQNRFILMLGASDYGAYDQVTIYVNVVTNTSYALEINYLAAMCYYA